MPATVSTLRLLTVIVLAATSAATGRKAVVTTAYAVEEDVWLAPTCREVTNASNCGARCRPLTKAEMKPRKFEVTGYHTCGYAGTNGSEWWQNDWSKLTVIADFCGAPASAALGASNQSSCRRLPELAAACKFPASFKLHPPAAARVSCINDIVRRLDLGQGIILQRLSANCCTRIPALNLVQAL